MLTTGFDVPQIDMIGLLRPTKSPGLHVQMIGRGGRVAEDKKNCLVLDYAGNTARLGPINRIKPKIKGKCKKTNEPITKTCPDCDTITTPMAKVCLECGYEFKFKQLLEIRAGEEGVLSAGTAWFKVSAVEYERHMKKNMPTSIAIRYHCGLRYFKDWTTPDHRGYAGAKSLLWLENLGIVHSDLDQTIAELRTANPPSKILVDTTKKYPEILEFIYDKV